MPRVFKMHKAGKARRAIAPVVAHPPRRVTRDKMERAAGQKPAAAERPREIGGPAGPEPTRYGDWERKGICYDF